MAARKVMSVRTARARMRAIVIAKAEYAERWLAEAVKSEDAGNPGFGLCLRLAVQDNAQAAFAAVWAYHALYAAARVAA